MPFHLNKILGTILSPIVIGQALLITGLVLALFKHRRLALVAVGCGTLWYWILASPATYRFIASNLELMYPVTLAEDVPNADAIVVLGGGMGSRTNCYPYAEMWASADRVWHAARLFKAGKAPIVVPSGSNGESSIVPLLIDLGVPATNIVVEGDSRNTEENARFVEKLLQERACGERPKILLVTSAWHMRRSELMYKTYAPGLDVVPVATDYEALVRCQWKTGFHLSDFLPNAELFFLNSVMLHEIVGYWGYRLIC